MKPFEVWNPIGGRWFILHWWTDEERGHVAFGKTEADLLKVAEGILKKKPHATMKQVLEIEIVSPPDSFIELAEMHDRREATENFYIEMVSRMAEAAKAGRTLPPPFEACEKYESEKADRDVDEWEREGHYGCKNCEFRVCLVGMTKGDLFAKYHDAWVAAQAPRKEISRRKGEPRRMPSTAEKASDDEALWYAGADFGHHCGGVILKEVDLTEGDDYRPGGLGNSTLFFFRNLRKVDSLLEDIEKMSEGVRAVLEEEERRRKEKGKKHREQEASRRLDEVIDFFEART